MHHKASTQAITSTKLAPIHQLVHKVKNSSQHPIPLEYTQEKYKEI